MLVLGRTCPSHQNGVSSPIAGQRASAWPLSEKNLLSPSHRITEYPELEGLRRIIESNSWLQAGPPKIRLYDQKHRSDTS